MARAQRSWIPSNPSIHPTYYKGRLSFWKKGKRCRWNSIRRNIRLRRHYQLRQKLFTSWCSIIHINSLSVAQQKRQQHMSKAHHCPYMLDHYFWHNTQWKIHLYAVWTSLFKCCMLYKQPYLYLYLLYKQPYLFSKMQLVSSRVEKVPVSVSKIFGTGKKDQYRYRLTSWVLSHTGVQSGIVNTSWI